MIGFLQKKAFLFDLDGTLVDSSALHERIFREVLRETAQLLPIRFDYEALKGKPTAEAFAALGIDPGEIDDMTGKKQKRYRSALEAGDLRAMPGARDLLVSLQDLSKRLYVVTGASRPSALAALKATGLQQFFEGLITAEDVRHGKPAPDGFRTCLERFAIRANEALGIEDSAAGIEACRAAGLDCVLVNNPDLRAESAFPGLVEFRLACIGQEQRAYA